STTRAPTTASAQRSAAEAGTGSGCGQPHPQAPPQQPPPPPARGAGAAGAALPEAERTLIATRLISGMVVVLSQLGQTACSSRSAMGRSSSKVSAQALQRYS